MEFLQSLTRPQKLSLSIIAVFIVAVFVAGGIWVLSPQQENLYEQLDMRLAAQAAQQLDEAGVPYEIIEDNGSNTIKVQAGEADRLRVTMSSELGIPQVTGLEIFDNADYSMTDFSQQIAYQRAIQGELSRTLTEMNGIRNARIHLSLAPKKLFNLEKQQSKAAVYLELEQGVSPDNINPIAVQQIVAHAINDLNASNVTVFDQQGHELSASDITHNSTALNKRLELINQREEKLTAQVYKLLGLLFKPQDIAVSVNIVMNFDQKTQRTEELLTNDSGEGVIVRKKQQQVNEAVQIEEEGVLNTPVNTESETEYLHGNELVETVFSPGVIEQLSVGIIVNAEVSAEEKAQITQLISAGIGINRQRGDQLVFEAIKVSKNIAANTSPAIVSGPVQSGKGTLQGQARPQVSGSGNADAHIVPELQWWMALSGILLLLLIVAVLIVSRRNRVRETALQDISNWMDAKNA